MNPRGLVAFMLQANGVRFDVVSPDYELRLAKYALRGFEVHVPFLERERVAYDRVRSLTSTLLSAGGTFTLLSKVYNRNLQTMPFASLSRLLVLELLHQVPDHLLTLNTLLDSVDKPNGVPVTCKYAPLDKQLERSPDMYWTHIPRGPRWNGTAIKAFLESLVRTPDYRSLSRLALAYTASNLD